MSFNWVYRRDRVRYLLIVDDIDLCCMLKSVADHMCQTYGFKHQHIRSSRLHINK